MIQLYGIHLSTYCAKVQIVLRHKNVEYTFLAPPGGYATDEYRAIVPMGTIPGFVDGDVVLSESEAINEYLEERYPEPPMLWGNAANRARIRTISRIHDTWVEPQIRALYPVLKSGRRSGEDIDQRIQQFYRRVAELEQFATPSPFMAGDRLSLADCGWGTTLIHAEALFSLLGETLTLSPALQQYRQTLAGVAAVAPVLEQCREDMQAWVDAL